MDLTEGAEILAGRFGRAALLSLKDRLTAHAHAQTHLIIKLGGPDQVFVVDGQTVPLTADRAVVVARASLHAGRHGCDIVLSRAVPQSGLAAPGQRPVRWLRPAGFL